MSNNKYIIIRSYYGGYLFENIYSLIYMISKTNIKCLDKVAMHAYTHVMGMVDPTTIFVEKLRVLGCTLDKEFMKLVHVIPWMVLHQTTN